MPCLYALHTLWALCSALQHLSSLQVMCHLHFIYPLQSAFMSFITCFCTLHALCRLPSCSLCPTLISFMQYLCADNSASTSPMPLHTLHPFCLHFLHTLFTLYLCLCTLSCRIEMSPPPLTKRWRAAHTLKTRFLGPHQSWVKKVQASLISAYRVEVYSPPLTWRGVKGCGGLEEVERVWRYSKVVVYAPTTLECKTSNKFNCNMKTMKCPHCQTVKITDTEPYYIRATSRH